MKFEPYFHGVPWWGVKGRGDEGSRGHLDWEEGGRVRGNSGSRNLHAPWWERGGGGGGGDYRFLHAPWWSSSSASPEQTRLLRTAWSLLFSRSRKGKLTKQSVNEKKLGKICILSIVSSDALYYQKTKGTVGKTSKQDGHSGTFYVSFSNGTLKKSEMDTWKLSLLFAPMN